MSRAKLLVSAFVAVLLLPETALAQTTPSGATVSASGQPYPIRLQSNGTTDVCGDSTPQSSCVSTRPANLNALGINYDDCISQQILQFSVTLTGFDGSESVQVFASSSSDCTQPVDRGAQNAVAADCWKVAPDLAPQVISTPQTFTFNVPVTTIVGWQQHPPFPVPASPETLPPSTACTAQASFAAVQMNVNFVPVDSSGNYAGIAFEYQINTDLVGPPAPTGVGETVGSTIFNLTWTANTDSDTAGYDIFIDPLPGQEGGAATTDGAVVSESGSVLVCPDAATTTVTDAASDVATDADGSPIDASTPSTPADAACYYVTQGGNTPTNASGYKCNDPILASGMTEGSGEIDSGAVSTPVVDEAGFTIDSGSVEEGAGGISTIPAQYALGQASGNVENATTVTGKSVGAYTIDGLTNGTTYNVVVAAVDGSGNVGPPSVQVCDSPAPIQDFWQEYSADGGGGSGFCALETVGAGGTSFAGVVCILAGAALARRRRRG